MIIMFIALIIGIFSLQYFVLNFRIQGINRAVISTPVELFFQDVYSSDGGAKFTVDEIEIHLNEYYQKALSKYVDEYDISYYFYNKSDYSMCLDEYCDGVEISVDCDLYLTYKYHRVMYYELSGN